MRAYHAKPSGHNVTRTTPRLEILARDVAESMDGRPVLSAGLHGHVNAHGVIEVDADDCRARGYFRLAGWLNGTPGATAVYRTDATGRRADLVAELETADVRTIVRAIAGRMATVAELEADGLDDPVRGLDSADLPDRIIGTDSAGNDVYESDAFPPCDCHGGAEAPGPCHCGADDLDDGLLGAPLPSFGRTVARERPHRGYTAPGRPSSRTAKPRRARGYGHKVTANPDGPSEIERGNIRLIDERAAVALRAAIDDAIHSVAARFNVAYELLRGRPDGAGCDFRLAVKPRHHAAAR